MASREALLFGSIPLLLSGAGILGLSLIAQVPGSVAPSNSTGGPEKDGGAAPSGPPSTPFPAETLKFEFPGADKRDATVTFESNTEVERVLGRLEQEDGAFAGNVEFDGKTLTGKGEFRVKVASMRTGIATRDEHLRSDKWLDATANPEIVFTVQSMRHVGGDRFEVAGDWTMHGITKPVKVEATANFIPGTKADELALNRKDKDGKQSGQAWVRVQAEFRIQLSAHDIKKNPKIEDAWLVRLDLFGRAAQ